jgi:hypothetical protein
MSLTGKPSLESDSNGALGFDVWILVKLSIVFKNNFQEESSAFVSP